MPKKERFVIVHITPGMRIKAGEPMQYTHPSTGTKYEVIAPSPLPESKVFKFAPPPPPDELEAVAPPPIPAGFEVIRDLTTGAVRYLYNKELGTVKSLSDKERFALEKTLPLILEDLNFGKGGRFYGKRSIAMLWNPCTCCCAGAAMEKRSVPAVNNWDLPCWGCGFIWTKNCTKDPLHSICCWPCNFASAISYIGLGSYLPNLACYFCCHAPFVHMSRAMAGNKYGIQETNTNTCRYAVCCPCGGCQVMNEILVQEDLTWGGLGGVLDDVTGDVAEKPIVEVFDVKYLSGGSRGGAVPVSEEMVR